MSQLIRKSHNVSSLLYHIVCPANCRRVVFNNEVDRVLKDVCLEIAKRYAMSFIELGTDRDPAHFLVQSVPTYRPTKIVRIVKSLTAREVFKQVPSVKQTLWGGEFWTDGYYISTVGRHGTEETIRNDVKPQGPANAYQQLHVQQLRLFE